MTRADDSDPVALAAEMAGLASRLPGALRSEECFDGDYAAVLGELTRVVDLVVGTSGLVEDQTGDIAADLESSAWDEVADQAGFAASVLLPVVGALARARDAAVAGQAEFAELGAGGRS